MYIKRFLESSIENYLSTPEIIAIIGPRQAGKTTLMLHLQKKLEYSFYMSFEDVELRQLFDHSVKDFLKIYIEPYKTIFIDEFQYSKEGGKNLKFVYDKLREKEEFKKIIISGSSSLELTIRAVKHLVGRIFSFSLYPLSFSEYMQFKDANLHEAFKIKTQDPDNPISSQFIETVRPHFLEYIRFGGYPRVARCEKEAEKTMVLKNIYQTYLLRDVKDLIDIADDYKMQTLVKALSIQIGNILSYQELSASVGVSFQTLKKYLNFLEKTFILYRIPPYYRNKRTELVKNPKIYFGDTGLRNAVLNDFRRMDIRVDKGALYENFHFSEYLKEGITPRFWRTKSGAEVDFVIEEYEKLFPIEIKGRLKASPSGLPISPSFRSFMTKYRPERGFVYNDEVSRRQGDVFFLPHWAHYPIY